LVQIPTIVLQIIRPFRVLQGRRLDMPIKPCSAGHRAQSRGKPIRQQVS